MPNSVNWSAPTTLLGRTKTLEQWLSDPLCAVGRDELGSRIEQGWAIAKALMRPPEPRIEAVERPGVVERQMTSPKYKGVTKHACGWQSQIKIDGKVVYLGMFQTAEEAAREYDRAIDVRKLGRAKNFYES